MIRMATSADLIEAHAFCRRQLLTAFLSGARPNGDQQPVDPRPALITGCLLAGVLLAALLWA